ncbi:uncharacterized protein LOC135113218 isoform X2 [Scylla paramamosain]|uniref:uncharacterized protein LOC135113218 isoform X2 n=1 Tax=Scylla paramamosain TaxID=85552 RepID=UPI0030831932
MSSSGDSTPPRSGSSHSCGSRLYSSTRHKKRNNIQRSGASAREDEVASDRVSKMDARPTASQSGDVNNTTLSKFLEAWAALQEDVNKLKSDRGARASVGSEPGTSGIRSGPAQDLGGTHEISASPPPSSSGAFSGFRSQEMSAEEGEIEDEAPSGSILLQAAKAYVPMDDCSEAIEEPIAAMVNHWFSHGLKEEDHKEILADEASKRPRNCKALIPVECNSQVLDALPTEAKKADFRLKEIGKDITKAATIMVKSLTVLDKFANEEQNQVIGQEVAMLNGALGLLGHANFKLNMNRRFFLKREINQKYAHLCTDKTPATGLLFGDDLTQATKQIEEAERLKNKFTHKKTSHFGAPGLGKLSGGKQHGFFGKPAFRGMSTRFKPYGLHKPATRGDGRPSYHRGNSSSKNPRGRGHYNPRQ